MPTHYRTCNICEALCGIEIEYEGTKVLSIKGDEKDPLSRGHICPKAVALPDFYDDPDRLRHPLKKTETGFVEISWEEAYDTIETKIKDIQTTYGDNAVATFIGNPNAHKLGNQLFLRPFIKSLRTKSRFSASTVDQMPHHVSAIHMLGHSLLNPVPDLDRTEFLLIMGANPIVSNGSMMTSPDIRKRMRAIQSRGGKIVVVDPRRTETADKANEHLFIKPESDAIFLLSMIHVLHEEGLINYGHLESSLAGKDKIKELVDLYPPEKAADLTGISADKIRALTKDFAKADKAVLYSRMGLSTQTFGGLAIWLSNVINILTANYDAEGGMMFTSPAVDPISFSPKKGRPKFTTIPRSRIRSLPVYLGESPSATLAEEIETEGEGQVKALVCIAGNPVLSVPNGQRLSKALEKLEFMVSTELYITETSRHADIILPTTNGLEIEQYDITFLNLAVRNIAKYSPALFPKKGNTKHEYEILGELTSRFANQPNPGLAPKQLLGFALQQGQYASEGLDMQKLEDHPHGVDLGPLKSVLMDRIQNNDDMIDLIPQIFLDDLIRLKGHFDHLESDKAYPFQMIGRRVLRQHNTWTHNSYRLSKGRNECTLMINPSDAATLMIDNGEYISVASEIGEVTVEAEITDEIMPGVVSLPQGFGAGKKSKMTIAVDRNSVSINDLTNHLRIDTMTGNAALNGVRVRLTKKVSS